MTLPFIAKGGRHVSIRSVKLGSFAPGVNNRLEPTKLATTLPDRSRGTYLYGGENIDLTADGFIKRRRGVTKRIAGDTHSLWSDRGTGYGVVNDTLVRFDANFGQVPIRAGMPRLPVSFSAGADNDIYWSNGQLIRRITSDADRPVATSPLAAGFTVTLTTGALREGRYLITATVLGADGESPAAPVQQIDVPDGGGLQLTAAETAQWFVSGPNGDVPTFQAAGASVALTSHADGGRRCETLNTALMPAGSIVRHYNGRMLVAAGQVLFASNPYNFGIYDPSSAYFPFPAPITVVEPMENGLYICADQTYWIADLFGGTLQTLAPYGAIPGSVARSIDDQFVFWQSPMGLIRAGKNADVKAVQEDALEFGNAASAATLYRQRDGMHAVVSTRHGVEPSIAVATSFMDAEVIQKGTVR
ncbi:MAG: hypothetical protein JSS14_21830 [Proteobacteria bacterium]|nr:hypothetical protein [Pseudomonadota bacterium]